MEEKTYRDIVQDFANKHKLVFQDHGECGFGRPCVGLLHGDSYVDYRPMRKAPPPDYYVRVFENDDFRYVPEDVPDAYHKHDCIAVLVHNDDYELAIRQLAAWVLYLDANNAKVVEYPTGESGIGAFLHGLVGHAFRVDPNAPD